jgi:hypothetical protein
VRKDSNKNNAVNVKFGTYESVRFDEENKDTKITSD